MEPSKRVFITTVINFLEEEISTESLSEQQKESIEVAIQCLQSTYEVNITDRISDEVLNLRKSLENLLHKNNDEKEAEVLKERGNTAMKNSEYDRAVEFYSAAIKLNSTNSKYYCNRAAAYDKMKKYEEAISDCKEALRLNPSYSKAFARMGNTYVNLNRYDDAKESYVNALKYDQNNADYKANLKVCEEQIESNSNITNNLSNLLSNPNILSLTSQLFSDPNGVRNLMSTMMTVEGYDSNPNIENLAQIFRNGLQTNNSGTEDLIAPSNNRTDADLNNTTPRN